MAATMSAEAVEARRAYQREYRKRNREKINSQRRKWSNQNPDKVRECQERYWENVARRNIRASWADYGIDEERYQELLKVVMSDEYAGIVLNAAIKADEMAAGHILLSVSKKLSYERVEYHERLGRCPLGKTDFYGTRRLFFHYLDVALKNMEKEMRQKSVGQGKDGEGL